MGFAKYHEDDQRIFDDRMYYRYGSFSFGIQSDYSKPVKYLKIEKSEKAKSTKIDRRVSFLYYCPFCGGGFNSTEGLFGHVIARHARSTDVVVLNGEIVKEQSCFVDKIHSLRLYCFRNKNGVINISDNSDNTYSIDTKTNQFEYNLLLHLNLSDFSELRIENIEYPVFIKQNVDINSATIDRIILGKCKSILFDDQVSEEMLSPKECLIYLKMLIYEDEDTDFFIDRIGYMSFEKSREVEELYYYHSIYKRNINKVLFDYQKGIISALLAILDGNYSESKTILKGISNRINEKIGCSIIVSLLINDRLSSEYLLSKYKPVGIVGNLVNELRRLSLCEKIESSWKDSGDLKELLLFKDYPLIQAIVALNDSLEQQKPLTQNYFTLLKDLTPVATIYYCLGIDEPDRKEQVYESMLEVHRDSSLLKEYIFSSNYSWIQHNISVDDGDLYVKAVEEQNRKNNLGFSESFLKSFPYDSSIKISPLGGETLVGASCFVISFNGIYIMLDCGIDTQKYDNDAYPALDQWDREIDIIIITHAHLDHCGGITKAHAMWPNAKIFMTPPTNVLLRYLLSDMAKVKNNISNDYEIDNVSIEKEVMYDTLKSIVTIEYEECLKVSNDIEVVLHSAGHIIGAAMVELRIAGKKILYTGDFCNYNQMLVSSYDINSLPRNIDYLITEATYYKRNKVNWNRQYKELKSEIQRALKNDNSIILPAASIGRSQELVCIIGEMKLKGEIPENIRLVIAGMAIPAVTQIVPYMNERYEKILGLFEEFDGYNYPESDVIVIASSGGMSKGSASYKIVNHWNNKYVKYTILANGYFDDETEVTSKLMEKNTRVNRMSLSTHADLSGLMELIDYVLPKEISFVHRGQGSDYDYRNLIHTCKNRFHGDIICRNLHVTKEERIFDIYGLMVKGNSKNG